MRRSARVVGALILAIVSLQAGLGSGVAQEATPAGELPIGVGITPLVGAVLDEVPTAPARLQVSQLILQAGAELPPSTLPGVSALLVQAGTFTARCGDASRGCQLVRAGQGAATPVPEGQGTADEEMSLAAGDSLVVPAGVPSGGRNEGADQVVLLVIAVLPQESGSSATPVS